MPSYTTEEARGFAPPLAEQTAMRKAASSTLEKDTFLSHSSKDNDLVPGIVLLLKNHGAEVYVDLGDDRLPEPPSVTTGEVLRETVQSMRRFVLLVSPNSKGSIWIPWELGLADGQKGPAAVALFPVVQTAFDTKWTEQEYLGLYSRIVWGPMVGHTGNVWMVYDHHTHSGTTLSRWLRR